jgi:L-ornithine N5-oxygenase
MTHRAVELLAVGGGPSSLALAVAIEELAPEALARDTLVIERAETISWQRGMLLPESQIQVSFLKDLVTLRNPRSQFSFVNYLHSIGRLSDFINMGNFWPYRVEISDYLQWVASTLSRVTIECSRTCVEVLPERDEAGAITGWLTTLADGSTIHSRYLVMAVGRDAYVPPVFAGLPRQHLVHSTEYLERMAELPKDVPYRVAVIGGGQSAAEMFDAVQRDLPGYNQRTMIMRSIGMKTYENSKFTNEMYFPAAVEDFFGARPEGREQILREMHTSNYSALATSTLETLYRQLYLDRLSGKGLLRIETMTDVTAARVDSGEVVLELTSRRTGAVEELPCDLVLLGTGFVRQMPTLIRDFAETVGVDRIEVTRDYRMKIPGTAGAACYLQGVNEATHGISDSLLSMLAMRATDIVDDILAGYGEATTELTSPQPAASLTAQ